jgi:hypothetical protein
MARTLWIIRVIHRRKIYIYNEDERLPINFTCPGDSKKGTLVP